MTENDDLIRALEEASLVLGIAPSTVGQRVGQGGRFYARLKAGKRVWPETARAVRLKIDSLLRDAA